MLDWLKNINKEYPDFWKVYLSKFDRRSQRFVALSTTTTGLDYKKDVILSISAFGIVNDEVLIGDSYEIVLLQYVYNHDHQLSNEFIVESKQAKSLEPEGIKKFVEFLGNATLIGHRINFDVEMINEALERIHCGRLKNEALDIEVMYRKWKDLNDDKHFTLPEINTLLKMPATDRNSSSEDAYAIALIFLKLKAKLGIK
ncbi:MAG: DNA polymerase III subunit epsilon [Flavobacterium sp. BFFFF1]|uniref:3'-5' exonuclease n=1 Tax=Flavobacterium sp. BFFFF1 TaxID=2015557 RepID=UPI000BD3B2B3|nr:exonuclease domain-containing protein [Flavobacterium sp. BFFFF1]OYU79031.1 MAG: DNA polymerase III subunit epsilon [Flavobacterium sp. BFFFF1]